MKYIIFMPLLLLNGCVWFMVGGATEGGYLDGNKSSASQTLRDQAITTSVKSKMVANTAVSARKINVTTEGGVVTLLGTVSSSIERELAIKIARETKGVKKVNAKL